MASPGEIGRGLPKTLPEDFREWDREASTAPVPANPGGSEADPAIGQIPKSADRTPNSRSPLSVPVTAEFDAFLQNPDLIRGIVERLREGGRATNDVFVPRNLPDVATVDGNRNADAIDTTVRREADTALFQSFSEVAGGRKTARKKWMIVTAVCACSILLLIILILPLVNHGFTFLAKQSDQPSPEVPDTQLETNTPQPSTNEPLTDDKPPVTAEVQQTTDDPPASLETAVNETAVNPPRVQTEMMKEQLTAPLRIPQDIKKQVAGNEPPPTNFATAGLGGNVINVSIFNGQAQPVVKAAVPSRPLTISAGVAVGMLIRKTTPIYPPVAVQSRVTGTVELQATISKDGTIKDLQVVSGPAVLQSAAVDAVRYWRYKPYMLNNEPIEVETTINVVFSLGG